MNFSCIHTECIMLIVNYIIGKKWRWKKQMEKIENEEIINARLAAYFDMCGSARIAKTKTHFDKYVVYALVCEFTTSKHEILEWIGLAIQKNVTPRKADIKCIVNLKTKHKVKATSHRYRTKISGEEAHNFINKIERYSLRHKEEFKIAHRFYDNYILYYKRGKSRTPTELAIAEECYQQMKALKRNRTND